MAKINKYIFKIKINGKDSYLIIKQNKMIYKIKKMN